MEVIETRALQLLETNRPGVERVAQLLPDHIPAAPFAREDTLLDDARAFPQHLTA